MKIEDLISENIPIWRAMVTEAGGEYVGVQMPLVSLCDKGDEPRVIFTRAGSTTLLSLTVSTITQEAVNKKLDKKVIKLTYADMEEIPEQQVLEFFTQYRDAFFPHASFESLLELAQSRAGLYRCLESVIKKNYKRS